MAHTLPKVSGYLSLREIVEYMEAAQTDISLAGRSNAVKNYWNPIFSPSPPPNHRMSNFYGEWVPTFGVSVTVVMVDNISGDYFSGPIYLRRVSDSAILATFSQLAIEQTDYFQTSFVNYQIPANLNVYVDANNIQTISGINDQAYLPAEIQWRFVPEGTFQVGVATSSFTSSSPGTRFVVFNYYREPPS
jgi:hypothetical protein